MRVHRNALVARHAVRALERAGSTATTPARLGGAGGATGEWLAVSRRQVGAVREALGRRSLAQDPCGQLKLASIRPHIACWALRCAWARRQALCGARVGAVVPHSRGGCRPSAVRLGVERRFAAVPSFRPRKASRRQAGQTPSRQSCRSVARTRGIALPRPAIAGAQRGCGFNEPGAADDEQAAAFRVCSRGASGADLACTSQRRRAARRAARRRRRRGVGGCALVCGAREARSATDAAVVRGRADCPAARRPIVLPLVPTRRSMRSAQLALASRDPWARQVAARAVRGSGHRRRCVHAARQPRRWVDAASRTTRPRRLRAERLRDAGPDRRAVAARRCAAPRCRRRTADGCPRGCCRRCPSARRPLQRLCRLATLPKNSSARADARRWPARGTATAATARAATARSRAQTCEALARCRCSAEAARNEMPAVARAYNLPRPCERQWREARDAAQRGVRMTAQAPPQRP